MRVRHPEIFERNPDVSGSVGEVAWATWYTTDGYNASVFWEPARLRQDNRPVAKVQYWSAKDGVKYIDYHFEVNP